MKSPIPSALLILSATLALASLPAAIDQDNDGVSDLWRALHPSAGAPTADPDGDGADNFAEAAAGTDPFSADSRLIATPWSDAQGNLALRWTGTTGKHYQLEFSPDLAAWTALPGEPVGRNNQYEPIVRAAGSPPAARQFWRVVATDADRDSDGLNDWEESLYGTSPTSADSDSDGLSDGAEVARGANPLGYTFTEAAPDTFYKLCSAAIDVDGAASTPPETHYYHLKAPAGYNADRSQSFPLLVYLHAAGPSSDPAGLHDGEARAPGQVQDLTSSTEFPAFVYVPVCPGTGDWSAPTAKAMVIASIIDLSTRYNIDRHRIYLVGFSMGGSGSYHMGHAYHVATGSHFAAVCRGAGGSPSAVNFPEIHASLALSPVWIHVGEVDSPNITALAIEAYNYLRPIRLAQGGVETITVRSAGNGLVPNPYPADLVADVSTITINGAPVARFSLYRGRGHEGHLLFENPDLFSWLFSHSGPEIVMPPSAPKITTEPTAATVAPGQPAPFSVATSGTPAPMLQWCRNGVAIPGAIRPTYTTPATTTQDNGALYTVVATNPSGTRTSATAALSVVP